MRQTAATGKGRASRPFLFALLACASSAATLAAASPVTPAPADPGATRAQDAGTPASRRLRPPPQGCDINHITSYAGRVTGYKRGATSTWLRIATDEATVEEVRVPHDGARDASAHFLLQRAPFPVDGLAAIERAPGKLRAGMRAVAWVCDDGNTPPRIDWQPAEAPVAGQH